MSLFSSASGTEHGAITATVQRYIDGYLGQDAAMLRQAFHGDARLISVEDGGVATAPTAAWFERTEGKRRAGGATLTARHQILGIDHAGESGVAKVQLDFDSHTFVDYQSLLKGRDGWQIVGKIYTTKGK